MFVFAKRFQIATALAACATLSLPQAAIAASHNTSGNAALALAALVGKRSPVLSASRKLLLQRYLAGLASAWHPAGLVFHVKADSVQCRASNVDITVHQCTLKFGAHTVTLAGRYAHELYATLIESGVPADGAAGSVFEALTALDCTITADEVAQRAGGGAACSFTTI